jgi:hypothetical protein
MARSRLMVRVDSDGTRKLWDIRAFTICDKQPLCETCALPWEQQPQYCVPLGYWQGLPTALLTFSLQNWFATSNCSGSPLYGLHVRYKGQASPRWGYNFDEHGLRAQVYELRRMAATDALYQRLESGCQLATLQQTQDLWQTWIPYAPDRLTQASEWVPWSEAQQVLRSSP